MKKNVVVLAEAASDIERGIHFYNVIEDGVGLYFRDSIIADLRRLGLYFGAHRNGSVSNSPNDRNVEMKNSMDLNPIALSSFTTLDAGEPEAIAMSLEWPADVLIMDESSGRAITRNLNIRITGTLGVLLKAKRHGEIPSLRSEMDSRTVSKTHSSPKLVRTLETPRGMQALRFTKPRYLADMKTLETDIEIGADGSMKLLSPLPAWLKPGRAHVLMTVESMEEKPKRQKLTAAPEMIARREAALENVRRLNPYRDITDPAAWQRETREDRPLPGRD